MSDHSIALQILDFIRAEALPADTHLPAQMLADRLRVSRSPVNDALATLAGKGLLRREPNRGYFVRALADGELAPLVEQLRRDEQDVVSRVYFRIADDRLRLELPETFSEALIKTRYGLTGAQLNAVLARIANEGWAEKKPGYGWSFSSMLTTADGLLQSYRLRLALEPAALLEPGYRLDPQVLARCRAAERHLLEGGIDRDSADQLHERGVRFHESLVAGSGNPFFIDTVRRVNRVRRLLSYRSMQDRKRYVEHCKQHLHLLDLLEHDRNEEAADAMREHLTSTLRNLKKIRNILTP
jgi:DNA-binding GntR family transcriptional regulator